MHAAHEGGEALAVRRCEGVVADGGGAAIRPARRVAWCHVEYHSNEVSGRLCAVLV